MNNVKIGMLIPTGFLLLIPFLLSAQKKLLENNLNDWNNWSVLKSHECGITNNGKFICYAYQAGQHGRVVVISNETKKADSLPDIDSAEKIAWSNDNRTLIFKKPFDSLCRYDAIHNSFNCQGDIIDYTIYRNRGDEVLVIKKKNGQILIQNTSGTSSVTIDSVLYYVAIEKIYSLIVVSKKGLGLLSLKDKKVKHISAINNVSGFLGDPAGKKLFFYGSNDRKAAYIYDRAKDKVRKLFDEDCADIPNGYSFPQFTPQFTPDGKHLVFTFPKKEKVLPAQQSGMIPQMEIWRTDDIYQEKIFMDFDKAIAFIGVDTPESILKQIGQGYVNVLKTGSDSNSALVFWEKKYFEDNRIYDNRDKAADFFRYALHDGNNSLIVPKSQYVKGQGIAFSPNGRFAFWMDLNTGDFFCYNTETRSLVNATEKIVVPHDMPSGMGDPCVLRIDYRFVDWMENDRAFLISDKYDLWQIDPNGNVPPVNLTGGYGRKHQICFRRISEEMQTEVLKNGSKLVVTAFDIKTKKSGYATIVLGNAKGLEPGVLYDKLFDGASATTGIYTRIFKKSKQSKDVLIVGQRADESVNLYLTRDFKKYEKLSNIHPEKNVNWLTASLITYPMREGKTGEAILYKPDNFDPSKKYPVLFTYYMKRSDGLHEYFMPGMDININIPYYVSNGYLVVVPDIPNYEPGRIARNTVNAVESVATYLKQYAWFDFSKMGIQGESFGGYVTNILVANSNMFAAAQASDAPSNMAVLAQFFGGAGGSVGLLEHGWPNLQTNLWAHPEVYIENSPLFQANKVTTPLLLTHGRKDENVGFNQGENMFYALKRFNKPAWMILYEGGDHAYFGDGNGFQDFNTRRQQFFDHYLKGKPMPLWMKQQTVSLELDTNNGKVSQNP